MNSHICEYGQYDCSTTDGGRCGDEFACLACGNLAAKDKCYCSDCIAEFESDAMREMNEEDAQRD